MKFLSLLFISCVLFGDEIVTDFDGATAFNNSICALRDELKEKFDKAHLLAKKNSQDADYRELLENVRLIRSKIQNLEEKWRKSSVSNSSDEPYGIWDIGETTLSQLVMEYGASDYLYVIPQELSGMKISLFSSIPLPHESWNEVIEMILTQNGVGTKRLNPFVKQLYILKLDPTAIEAIVAKEEDLQLFANHTRLFYVLSPPPDQLRSVQAFFERFSDPKQTTIQAIGSKIALVASKDTIEKLLGLFHAVWEQSQGKVARFVTLNKIMPQEAEKILKTIFADSGAKNRPTYFPSSADELVPLVMPQGLVLIGENDTVERGLKILADLENQLEDPSEKIIYWYTCKHSNPDDIAEVLSQVYDSLMHSGFEKKEIAQAAYHPTTNATTQNATPASLQSPPPQINQPIVTPPPTAENPCPLPYLCPGPGYNPVMPATAPFVQPSLIDPEKKFAYGNFIVDGKTGSILMVVRREELPKIKSLLKKMDVPKKMVQLEVLLVEKKIHDNRQLGLEILQLGTNSSGKKETAVSYQTLNNFLPESKEQIIKQGPPGLFSFIFSRPSGSFPAADIKFNFLISQEDVQIKANPSVLAINQTPAMISIVEEISINNGAFPFNSPTGTTIMDSFTRAQFGITITLTPTIHAADSEDGGLGFVSLETDVEFDSTKMILESRDKPPVTRRHITNEVRVADGETIILGGLRQHVEEDSRDKIPFLGDLPGIGKLFGTAKTREVSTEMFIFITPRIVKDPIEDLRCIRQEEYAMRAGDIPEFLQCIDDAKEYQRKKLFRQSLKLLFDMY